MGVIHCPTNASDATDSSTKGLWGATLNRPITRPIGGIVFYFLPRKHKSKKKPLYSGGNSWIGLIITVLSVIMVPRTNTQDGVPYPFL